LQVFQQQQQKAFLNVRGSNWNRQSVLILKNSSVFAVSGLNAICNVRTLHFCLICNLLFHSLHLRLICNSQSGCSLSQAANGQSKSGIFSFYCAAILQAQKVNELLMFDLIKRFD
jgi:hypothetical protein